MSALFFPCFARVRFVVKLTIVGLYSITSSSSQQVMHRTHHALNFANTGDMASSCCDRGSGVPLEELYLSCSGEVVFVKRFTGTELKRRLRQEDRID